MTNSLTNSKLYQFLKKYQSETLKRKILKTKRKKDNINKRYLSYIKKGLEITDKIVILKIITINKLQKNESHIINFDLLNP